MKKLKFWFRILFNIFFMSIMLITSPVNSNGELSIRPSLRVGEAYTSNSTDDSSDPDGEKWDLISSVVPGINLYHLSRTASITGGYSMDSKFYHKNPELNYYGHSGNFSVGKELSRTISINFNDSIGYTKSSGSAPLEEGALFSSSEIGLKTKRTGRLNNSSSLTTSFQLEKKTNFSVGISESMLFLEDSELVDTRTDVVSLSWNKSFSSNTITLGYDYSTYSYDMYDYSFNSESNSIGNHSVQVGFMNTFNEALSFNISGRCVYTPDPEPLLFCGGGGNTGFTKNMRYSSLHLTYSNNVSSTGGLNKEININQTLSAGWTLNASKKVSISITGSGSDNISKPSEDVKTTSYTTGVNISWNIRPWITTNAGYSHFQHWAEKLAGENFTTDQVSINLTIMPEGWKF